MYRCREEECSRSFGRYPGIRYGNGTLKLQGDQCRSPARHRPRRFREGSLRLPPFQQSSSGKRAGRMRRARTLGWKIAIDLGAQYRFNRTMEANSGVSICSSTRGASAPKNRCAADTSPQKRGCSDVPQWRTNTAESVDETSYPFVKRRSGGGMNPQAGSGTGISLRALHPPFRPGKRG